MPSRSAGVSEDSHNGRGERVAGLKGAQERHELI